MTTRQTEAYRREAETCIDIAQRIPIREERQRIMELAQRWLRLAERAEIGERPDRSSD